MPFFHLAVRKKLCLHFSHKRKDTPLCSGSRLCLADGLPRVAGGVVSCSASIVSVFQHFTIQPCSNSQNNRVEAGQNTSTVALQVVRGDKKRTQCSGL
jgi:hypothetical protein